MIDIYETLTMLQVEKEAKNIEPPHVLFEEILADVREQTKEELRQLCKEKKVEFHKTLNSISFNITTQNKSEQAAKK